MKSQTRDLALQTLHSPDRLLQNCAALIILSIAVIELPRNEWPDLLTTLSQNVIAGDDALKQSSLVAISYLCESGDMQLRASLAVHSNVILTAVVHGARCEQLSQGVRYAAMAALCDVVPIIGSNLRNEFERNYILDVVSEAAKAQDVRVGLAGLGCLNYIMRDHYETVPSSWKKYLSELSMAGLQSEEEDTIKLAAEFWCIVCEKEISFRKENHQLHRLANLARNYVFRVLPTLLQLMCRQVEDAGDTEYSVSCAAYQALELYVKCLQNEVVQPVAAFVQGNIFHENWQRRSAAVAAFGAIIAGPPPSLLEPLIKKYLPVFLNMLEDSSAHVRESISYTLGRICDRFPMALDYESDLWPLLHHLLECICSTPSIASSCYWALARVADRFAPEAGSQTSPLSKHFHECVQYLVVRTETAADHPRFGIARYEALKLFIERAANDSLGTVWDLLEVVIRRLDYIQECQSASAEQQDFLVELQISLVTLVMTITQRLASGIGPQADRIIQTLLQVLSVSDPASTLADAIFATLSVFTHIIKEQVVNYVDRMKPLIVNSLSNRQRPSVSLSVIRLASDIVCALNGKIQHQSRYLVESLLDVLGSPQKQHVTAALVALGDIALVFRGNVTAYLGLVGRTLRDMTLAVSNADKYRVIADSRVPIYVATIYAWERILSSYKGISDTKSLKPYITPIYKLLYTLWHDHSRGDALTYLSMRIIR